ncbi:META domain-containing protein [Streptomyces bambusae]|uniref:META domain-containing protein n=1 Tax=Streptomyces bambusae TaxID=1550616 RepID=A0ABS6ZAW5_9ACTN|nr:META domain-containing protein [Streptomyces bambusae]MBW5484909.1 META domain-containing protein [Streptomyces bambusae]
MRSPRQLLRPLPRQLPRHVLAASVAALVLLGCGPAAQPGPAGVGPGSVGSASVRPGGAGPVTPATPLAEPPLTGPRWVVDALVTEGRPAPLPAGAERRAELTIAADGATSGNLGCNRFTARAAIDGRTIAFGPVAATRMACTGPAGEVERAFADLLRSGPLHYEIKDGTLTLTATTGAGLRATPGESTFWQRG